MNKYYEESLINIKICGIKSVEIVDFLINNFVNYFGLIFYESSPRFVNLKEADLLVKAAKNSNTKPVGVFVDYKIEKIQTYIDKLNLKYIQLHGNESVEYCRKIKNQFPTIKLCKAFRLKSIDDLENINQYEKNVDAILLDAWDDKALGGTGNRIPTELLIDKTFKKGTFLSMFVFLLL